MVRRLRAVCQQMEFRGVVMMVIDEWEAMWLVVWLICFVVWSVFVVISCIVEQRAHKEKK